MPVTPVIPIVLPGSGVLPGYIELSGTLDSTNTPAAYQYYEDLAISAPSGTQQYVLIELLSMQMTNYMQVETQAGTPGQAYTLATTFYNDFYFGGVSATQEEWNPRVISCLKKTETYDGTTDYAGNSGFVLTSSVVFDPNGPNGNTMLMPIDELPATIGVTAMFEEAYRAPTTGTVLRNYYTKWNCQLRYYYA